MIACAVVSSNVGVCRMAQNFGLHGLLDQASVNGSYKTNFFMNYIPRESIANSNKPGLAAKANLQNSDEDSRI